MQHDSFLHMHAMHIYETVIALGVVAAWWYFAKKNR